MLQRQGAEFAKANPLADSVTVVAGEVHDSGHVDHIRVPFIIYTEQRTAVGFEGDRVSSLLAVTEELRWSNLLALYVANNRFFLLHMSCIDIIVPV